MGLVNRELLVHLLMNHFMKSLISLLLEIEKAIKKSIVFIFYFFLFPIKTFQNSSLTNALRASIKLSFC